MNKKTLIGILIVVIFILIGSIFLILRNEEYPLSIKTKHINIGPADTSIDTSNVVKSNNQFALDYYLYLSKENDGNIFFSPFSISSALAMTYEGARGGTAEEMKSVFHFITEDNLRRNEYAKIFNKLNEKGKDYEFSVANALWVQKDYELLEDYINIVRQRYGGGVANLDFIKNTEKSRLTINSWVEKKTNNKIKNLIPKSLIDNSTRLILTNTIYFKGEWEKAFKKMNTKDEDFTINKDNAIKAPTMKLSKEHFNYTEDSKVQILEMPYKGKELSMLIILPKNKNLVDLENLLSVEKLSKWKKNLRSQLVDVFIPKFKLEDKHFMANDLKNMGMLDAFDQDRADFSGLSGQKELFIGEVIHQAFVEVNEKGTEAAAATAVTGMLGASLTKSKPPKVYIFRADHPFIFLIQDKSNGNIIFIGRITNPIK